MLEAPLPLDEDDRQRAVDNSGMVGTLPEERFDRLTRLARRLFGVEIALVSLSDHQRQWFKSRAGLGFEESPRSTSFCSHVVHSQQPLIIEDSLQDERFHDNPFVLNNPSVRFYAGIPLVYQGQVLGTFCLAGFKPRSFSAEDLEALTDLAGMAEAEIISVQHAIVCPLTGLLNRRGLMQLGEQVHKLCVRQFAAMTCIFLI